MSSSVRSRTVTVSEPPEPPASLSSIAKTTYVFLSCILAGVYVIFTKDNQIYYTVPHGFDYFLNLVMAVQYSSAINILAGGLFEFSGGGVSHTRWINFWNCIFFFIFPLYAVLAAAAAGWYQGALFSSIANDLLDVEKQAFPGVNAIELQNNSIIVICVLCVLNYALIPLYLLSAWCCDPCKLFTLR